MWLLLSYFSFCFGTTSYGKINCTSVFEVTDGNDTTIGDMLSADVDALIAVLQDDVPILDAVGEVVVEHEEDMVGPGEVCPV